jgi:hypothetical protein
VPGLGSRKRKAASAAQLGRPPTIRGFVGSSLGPVRPRIYLSLSLSLSLSLCVCVCVCVCGGGGTEWPACRGYIKIAARWGRRAPACREVVASGIKRVPMAGAGNCRLVE